MLEATEAVFPCISLELLTKNNKNNPTTGSKIPLVICANRITSMDRICKEEKITPVARTKSAILLYPTEFVCHPKHSQTTNAAAIGAVIAEVIPAANKPKDINVVAKPPYKGAKACPKSEADSTD